MFATSILGYTLTTIWYIAVAFLFIIVALWPGMMAKSKGRSFWLWFILSIPFWLITFFVVLLMKDESTPQPPSTPPTAQ